MMFELQYFSLTCESVDLYNAEVLLRQINPANCDGPSN